MSDLLVKTARILLMISILLCSYITCKSQDIIPVELTVGKMTHLYFNAEVKYCDVGNSAITHTENGNIIALTTAKANFEETNLTVITTDNRCYNFLLIYNAVPRTLNITTNPKSSKLINAIKSKPVVKISIDSIFSSNCKKITLKASKHPDISIISKRMALTLDEVAADDSCLYIAFEVENHSSTDFHVSIVNFQTITTNIMSKINREDVLKPIYIFNKKEVFSTGKTEKLVYVFKKIQLEKGKQLFLEIAEQSDNRFLSLVIPRNIVNNPQLISKQMLSLVQNQK